MSLRKVAGTIPNDLRVYAKAGISGMTYMHLPMLSWGVRAITQLLYAQLAWDIDTDEKKLIDEYFLCRYGSFSNDAKKAYELIENAWELCSSWRAWCQKSILTNLMNWDGKKPDAPLYYDDHFDYDMYDKGMESVENMKKALKILKEIRIKDRENFLNTHVFEISVPVNPTDTSFGEQSPPLDEILGDDIRNLDYGIDTMLLMCSFTKYHELLLNGENTEKIWDVIENTAQKLDKYYMPITYTTRAAELTCLDAFTRTQLKPLYFRCKQYRLKG